MTDESETIFTHCSICEQICGLAVTVKDGAITSIKPDKKNPYSWKDFCIKAARSADVRDSKLRLQAPMRRVGDHFEVASYDDAINDIAERLRKVIADYGPQAVGYYTGNPGSFSFGGRSFMDGLMNALGVRNKYSVGSIDQNATHVVTEHMLGAPLLALVPDVDRCDYFLLLGANPAISKMNWLGKNPDGWRRILERVKGGAELVVVDPRLTETAKKATRHIAIRPDGDWAFLLALIKIIFDEKRQRLAHVEQFDNVDLLRIFASARDLDDLSQRCDVPVGVIRDVARGLAAARSATIIPRTGPSQGRNGVVTEWLATALNFITGNVDAPGGRTMPAWPFRWPALVRAMAKPDIPPSRVRGLKPVAGGYTLAELPDEIETPGEGQLRAFILHGGNPVASGPDGRALDRAFAQLDLLVGVDLFHRESHRHAHWIIPSSHFLERDELNTVVHALNDEPFAQYARAVVPPPDGVMLEWKFFEKLAETMDVEMFGGVKEDPDSIAGKLLAFGGQVTLEDIKAAAHGLVYGKKAYGHLWADLAETGVKVNLCPDAFLDLIKMRLAEPIMRPDVDDYPYQIISRRRNGTMNAWLSDTVGMLGYDDSADVVEVNPEDAARDGFSDGDIVSVRSSCGEIKAHVRITSEIRSGVALIEQGWGSPVYDPNKGGSEGWLVGVMRNTLVSNKELDPMSGVPRLNGTPVAITLAAGQ